MPDYQALLDAAHRRLDELSAFNLTRVPQAETLAPAWLTTAEGLAYLDALRRGDTDESLHIWDAVDVLCLRQLAEQDAFGVRCHWRQRRNQRDVIPVSNTGHRETGIEDEVSVLQRGGNGGPDGA